MFYLGIKPQNTRKFKGILVVSDAAYILKIWFQFIEQIGLKLTLKLILF